MIQLIKAGYQDPAICSMIELLNSFQIGLYGEERCNLDSMETLQQSGAYILGAYSNDILVGMGAVKLYDGYGEIKRMFVDPAYREQNVACQILQTLERYAMDMGKNIIYLETGYLQTAAIAFYKKCGYRIIEKFGKYRPNPVSIYFEKEI